MRWLVPSVERADSVELAGVQYRTSRYAASSAPKSIAMCHVGAVECTETILFLSADMLCSLDYGAFAMAAVSAVQQALDPEIKAFLERRLYENKQGQKPLNAS